MSDKLDVCIENLEQQIRWIEDIHVHKFPGCGHTVNAMRQAIALLKAQEPRLITNADFENKELVDSAESMPAWIEYRHGEEWDEYNDGNDDGWSVVYQFNFESEFYRCWTARPTYAQRKAVKWE